MLKLFYLVIHQDLIQNYYIVIEYLVSKLQNLSCIGYE